MTYPDREPRRPAVGYPADNQPTEQYPARDGYRGREEYPTQVGAPVPLEEEVVRREEREEVVRRDGRGGGAVHRDEVLEQRQPRDERSRVKTVMVVCAVIDVVFSLFAIVLAIHVVLVIGSANAGNGFAQMIEGWSSAVSLGLRDLFTPENLGARTLLNDGLAAIIWLVLRAVLTNLITRLALPVGQRRVWYRRTATY
ncbi:hypothetical protein [Umezawaea sp. Da 62-37]|uniref:hypothetical protein n=1 Tax=Umezawaea sp. Da 62-37 TaxID=3075927 RepID=UPI0028F6C130|nr:hypothetical protein [Umezawaea sp. Da 62-37]WNV89427.1 hypothetical protein RM788_14325 [Umezawaea sp. Da 62-37]